uniref:glucuronosyltransferase n=1 Tax=Plectus sambesii TaxID=2011161 RepID=A0A914WXN7_9BILA
MSLKAVLLVFAVCLAHTKSFKVLVYSPAIGHSHCNFMGKIADALLDAGHEVLVYVPVHDADVLTNGTKRAPVLRVDVLDDPFLFKNSPIKSDPFSEKADMMGDETMQLFAELSAQACQGQVSNKALMETLRDHHFDVAIAEFYDYCPFGILKLLGIPANILASAVPMTETIGDLFGVPQPLSYVPSVFGTSTDEMSYKERAMNIMTSGIWRGMLNRVLDKENEIFRRYYGSDFPALDDLAKKTSLAFVNADEFFELPRPITHRIIYVGGIGVPKAEKLSNELARVVEASDKGVIVLSFGSIAHSTLLPMEKKLAVLRAMANFPEYTFIWKYERPEDDMQLFMNYTNVYPMKWVPQVDLLNHPKVKVFITHGGMNSLTEAMTTGTPTVAIPLFGDQEHNVAVAVKRGVSVFVSKRNINAESLTAALQEVLQNEKYELNAKRMAQMVARKPIKPKDLIVKWTEFVAEFQDFSNLDVAGRDFSFVKYFLIDIIAPLVMIIITSVRQRPFITRIFASVPAEMAAEEPRCCNHGPGYASPKDAMQGPRETVIFVACPRFDSDKPDMLATVDVDPTSSTYCTVISRVDFPHARDEVHHTSWNACSSCFGDANVKRTHLAVPCLNSSRVYFVDTTDPKNLKLTKTLEAEQMLSHDVGFPHSGHCLADGNIMISTLGDAEGNGKGDFILIDSETFEVTGTWVIGKTAPLNYDFWYQPRHNVMISTEWGPPKVFTKGFKMEDVLSGLYFFCI